MRGLILICKMRDSKLFESRAFNRELYQQSKALINSAMEARRDTRQGFPMPVSCLDEGGWLLFLNA